MRRVCRQQPELGPGPMEPVKFWKNIIDDGGQSACLKSVPQSLHVHAIDDQRWVAPIRSPRPIEPDDGLVVIDRRFRPNPAKNSQQFHDCSTSGSPAKRISLVATNPIFS